MRSALSVRIDGTPLDALGLGYSPPTYSSTFAQGAGGGGCEEASTTIAAPQGYRHPLLREGRLMEVLLGSWPVFSGLIDDVDRDTWVIHARGLGKQAADVACLTLTGETTTFPNTAINAARVRGRLRSTSGLPDANRYGGATTDAPNQLSVLLDGAASKAGKWWTVWADGVFRYESLPTVPTMHLIPKALDMPISYEEYASCVVLRYFDSTSHTAKTVYGLDSFADARYPKEVTVDATPLGEITAASATSHAAGIIAQGKSRPGYTASIEATGWQLVNDNFAPIDVRRVTAGRMVRLHGVVNDFTGQPFHDIVIGRAQFDGAGSTIQIDPMGMVSNGSQEDVIAKVLGAAWEKTFNA